MANKRLGMVYIEEIQRLKGLGIPQVKVSKILGVSRRTVIKYWNSSLDQMPTSVPTLPKWFTRLDKTYLEKKLFSGVPKKTLHKELSDTYDLPSYQLFSSFLKKTYET